MVTGTPTMVVSSMAGGSSTGLGCCPGNRSFRRGTSTTTLTGETLLSFEVGEGLSDLHAWRYDGTAWAAYDTHVVYREGIASFSVTQFSGYAVSAVPEPGTWAMLSAGAAALAVGWRRKRRA